jgi:hypothetical protein
MAAAGDAAAEDAGDRLETRQLSFRQCLAGTTDMLINIL